MGDPLSPSATIMKLLAYTVAMFGAPLGTYRACQAGGYCEQPLERRTDMPARPSLWVDAHTDVPDSVRVDRGMSKYVYPRPECGV
jgi:hypothetical protein